ncbi:MAG: exodeoxyribonuclease VII small subunit, partial [Methylococcales bacterium]|nr:exodeoxyribonuclease VII small subunit [Methylococcales bacterium]
QRKRFMPDSPEKQKTIDPDMLYEDAVAKLEALVRSMESDSMPLEDVMKNYEIGTQLHKICEKRLDEAQGRIEIIRKKRNGEIVTEPFGEEDTTKTQPESAAADETSSNQDGELF